MKLRLAIIDDEYFIRQRLKKIIPWEALELEFAGEGENGHDVVRLLEEAPPDILMLDIRMPKMDGLEAARLIHEDFPWVKVIILSGYSDFEYARSTMRSGVSDYLLKPVDQETLTRILEGCIQKILMERKKQEQLRLWEHSEMQNHIAAACAGQIDFSQICGLHPELSSRKYGRFLAVFSENHTWDALCGFLKSRLPAELFRETLQETESVRIMLLLSEKQETLTGLDPVFPRFFPQKNEFCFLAAGTVFPLDSPWKFPYRQTLLALDRRYFEERPALILKETEEMPSAEPDSEKIASRDLTRLRQKLILLINTRDEKGFCGFIGGLFEDIRKHQNIRELHLLLSEFYVTCRIHFPQVFADEAAMRSLASEQIAEEYSLDTLKSAVISCGMECMDTASLAPSDVSLSRRITGYIEKHYQDADLSVHKLAEIFQLNPSYMGMLFKKVNHQSILQYLIRVRMEAAVRLITEGQYRITDIAKMVGYPDVFYFSKRFKKTYGVPPKEFIGRQETE